MIPKKRFSFLGVPLDPLTQKEVLEKIKLYLSLARSFVHIVSINPENVVITHNNQAFRDVCVRSDLALSDGIGVILGARLLGYSVPERVSGSVLLPRLLDLVGAMGLTGVLIGSQANLADNIAQCYSRSYPEATFIGTNGYKNIAQPTPEEDAAIEAIVRNSRPHFVFVAFGSPAQEIWIDTHRKLLEGCICMGVGGGFDYLSGASSLPPSFIRQLGLEWLYRLVKQPWRVRRQMIRLPLFIGILLSEWIRGIIHPSNEKKSH
jgi:N-acetylglucosaminyldiphosphoundecaprenol N-acetyl-beta-D-mannosaminyltransferase